MARTPNEIFQHHAEALSAEDLDEIVADYANDAVFITSAGTHHGKDSIRGAFSKLLSDVPRAKWTARTEILEGAVLFLRWVAQSDTGIIAEGVDTFMFRDGFIQVQTVHYTLHSRRLPPRLLGDPAKVRRRGTASSLRACRVVQLSSTARTGPRRRCCRYRSDPSGA